MFLNPLGGGDCKVQVNKILMLSIYCNFILKLENLGMRIEE